RTARRMRRVPGVRRRVVAQALAVDVAEHGRALRAARPVLAGAVFTSREGFAVGRRAGERVVPVRLFVPSVDDLALLTQRSLLGEIVLVAVQIVDALGDHDALGIGPGAFADAVARVHRAIALRA